MALVDRFISLIGVFFLPACYTQQTPLGKQTEIQSILASAIPSESTYVNISTVSSQSTHRDRAAKLRLAWFAR